MAYVLFYSEGDFQNTVDQYSIHETKEEAEIAYADVFENIEPLCLGMAPITKGSEPHWVEENPVFNKTFLIFGSAEDNDREAIIVEDQDSIVDALFNTVKKLANTEREITGISDPVTIYIDLVAEINPSSPIMTANVYEDKP